jgi:hypothetical protein
MWKLRTKIRSLVDIKNHGGFFKNIFYPRIEEIIKRSRNIANISIILEGYAAGKKRRSFYSS